MSGDAPAPTRRSRREAAGRRRAVLRAVGLVVLAAVWLGIGAVGGPRVGRLSEVQRNDNAGFLPSSAESQQQAVESERFSDTSTLPFFLVVERSSGITDSDEAAVQQLASAIPGLPVHVDAADAGGRTFRVGDYLASSGGVQAAVPSRDGQALLLPVLVDRTKAGRTLPDGSSVLLEVAQSIRAAATDRLAASGLHAYVTGPAGLLADLVTAFSGIDGTLLGVSLIAVFVILLLVYRSPLLPVAALMTAAFGLGLAALVVYPLAEHGTLTLNGQSQGILSILVIGAATDYALLLVSRYREELHDHPSPFVAMRRAWRAAVEPIGASAATVVLGLLCLLLSRLGSTHSLGPVGAFGIVGALLSALTLLPVLLVMPVILLALVVCGVLFALGTALVSPALGAALALAALVAGGYFAVRRRQVLRSAVANEAGSGADGAPSLPWYARAQAARWLFWPRPPQVDHVHREDVLGTRGLWGRVAGLVGRHPRRVWVTTLVVLLVAAAFVPTFKASGTSAAALFRGRVESVTGQDVLARHFPSGAGSPALLVVQETDADQTLRLVRTVKGVAGAALTTEGPARPGAQPAPKVVDGQVQVEVTLAAPADSPDAEDTVRRLRSSLDAIGQDVLVGGTSAVDLDVRDTSRRDLEVVVPAVLVVIALVLMLLLRSVVAPLLLIGANVLSFGATLGVSALVFDHVLDYPGGDPSIPLYAFVFLVALGIDYSIFLMTRVREESLDRGTRPGVLVALAVTGGVITSAGVVLAATFGALVTIPILFLQQIAFIVAFGVLLDTLVVRSLLVPSVVFDVGRRAWWPSAMALPDGDGGDDDDESVASEGSRGAAPDASDAPAEVRGEVHG